jgi:hypothetical protein
MIEVNKEDARHLKAITDRSAVDAQFRAALLRDPRRAIREATGVAVPADLTIRFVEPPRGIHAVVVLPAAADDRGDVAVEEMELFSGIPCWTTCNETCQESCSQTCLISGLTIGSDAT